MLAALARQMDVDILITGGTHRSVTQLSRPQSLEELILLHWGTLLGQQMG